MIDEYFQTESTKTFLRKCISFEWMGNSHFSKWKTFHRNTFILKRILLAQNEMSSPNERRDSYHEFGVCDICHGTVDQYFSWNISYEEVMQAIVLRVKGPPTVALKIKWLPVAKENVQGGLCWANTELTQCLVFPAPTSEIPFLWMEMHMLCKEESALAFPGLLSTGSWIMSPTKRGQLKSHSCS